jgi:hypothetical protein
MPEFHVSRRLQVLSTVLLKLVFLEQSVTGMLSLGLNTSYLSKIAGLNSTAALLTLIVVHFAEGASVCAISVPSVQDRAVVLTCMFLILAAASSVEAGLAAAADDTCTRTKSIFLLMACLMHAVSTACNRAKRSLYAGAVGEDFMPDRISEVLRDLASRYRLASVSAILLFVLCFYTLCFSENPIVGSRLTKMLGRAAYARNLAIAAFIAAVGAEDRSKDGFGRGLTKNL